jgi:hypothetical protein
MSQRVNEEMVERIVSKTRVAVPLGRDAACPPRQCSPARSTLPSPPVTPTKPGFQPDVGRKGECF